MAVEYPIAFWSLLSITELSAMWKKEYKDFNYYIGANFSYAKSKVVENGEGYQPYPERP